MLEIVGMYFAVYRVLDYIQFVVEMENLITTQDATVI